MSKTNTRCQLMKEVMRPVTARRPPPDHPSIPILIPECWRQPAQVCLGAWEYQAMTAGKTENGFCFPSWFCINLCYTVATLFPRHIKPVSSLKGRQENSRGRRNKGERERLVSQGENTSSANRGSIKATVKKGKRFHQQNAKNGGTWLHKTTAKRQK